MNEYKGHIDRSDTTEKFEVNLMNDLHRMALEM
jgi:hypothetical protein